MDAPVVGIVKHEPLAGCLNKRNIRVLVYPLHIANQLQFVALLPVLVVAPDSFRQIRNTGAFIYFQITNADAGTQSTLAHLDSYGVKMPY